MQTFTPTLRQRTRLLLSMPIAALSAPTIPFYTLYGGATITGAHDAAGTEYTVCCAKDNRTGAFGLIVIADDVVIVEMPVPGRGSVWVSLFDGMAYWKGWEGSQKFGAPIPGFVPFTPLPALDARLGAAEAAIQAIAQAVQVPIKSSVIATADDPLWQGDGRRIVDVLAYYGLIERAKA